MITTSADTLAIIFPNIYDRLVPDLSRDRLMASIPFGSRYRMIDFLLSSLVNSGVDNIGVIVRENYYSLLDHIGTGREWDLARKNGGINIFPPYARRSIGMYNGRIEALSSIMGFLKEAKEKYVVMADTNIAMNFDFSDLIARHAASGADVTVAYKKEPLPKSAMRAMDSSKGYYYSLVLDGDRVVKMNINPQATGNINFGMNIYICEREWLIEMVREAHSRGAVDFERDILIPHMYDCVINAYEFTGYTARISSLQEYFAENMKLLEGDNLDKLFNGGQIYTKIRDDNPTRYVGNAKAENVLVADGCVIEGTVENSILFRGVKIAKGAVVKNCILMQDTIVGEDVVLDHVITDKKVTISAGASLKGEESFPVYIAKGKEV